jgi:hypothetical protein
MAMSDILAMNRIDWDWFLSCTLAKRNASDRELINISWALVRQVAKRQGLDYRRLPVARRIESGLDPAHRHFHLLLGGLRRVGAPERMVCMAIYQRLLGYRENSLMRIPNGTIRVRLYDSRGGALGYLCKVLNQSEAYGWMHAEVELSDAARLAASRSANAGLRMAAGVVGK